VASGRVSSVNDAIVLHIDPCPKLVGKAEPIGFSETFDVIDVVRERVIVMTETEVNRDAERSAHCFGGDPGH
jgi:hypothetical protein